MCDLSNKKVFKNNENWFVTKKRLKITTKKAAPCFQQNQKRINTLLQKILKILYQAYHNVQCSTVYPPYLPEMNYKNSFCFAQKQEK